MCYISNTPVQFFLAKIYPIRCLCVHNAFTHYLGLMWYLKVSNVVMAVFMIKAVTRELYIYIIYIFYPLICNALYLYFQQ